MVQIILKQQKIYGFSSIEFMDEETNFNADIANDNNFKSFKYKTKLLGNIEANEANGILKNIKTS